MKNFKWTLALVMALLALVLCACGESKKEDENVVNPDNTAVADGGENVVEEPEVEPEIDPEMVIEDADEETFNKFEVVYRGLHFKLGDDFVTISANFGDEIKPSETYTPCAALVAGEVTAHYYDGISIETNDKGLIYLVRFDEPKNEENMPSFGNGIKFGSTPDEVINAFGKASTVDEYNITYGYNNFYVGIGLDTEGSGNVNYVQVEAGV